MSGVARAALCRTRHLVVPTSSTKSVRSVSFPESRLLPVRRRAEALTARRASSSLAAESRHGVPDAVANAFARHAESEASVPHLKPRKPPARARKANSDGHVSVLVEEVVAAWRRGAAEDGASGARERVLVDATSGAGGHAEAVLNADPLAKVLCVDCDGSLLDSARERLHVFGDRVRFHHGSFAELHKALRTVGFPTFVDGVLMDLGMDGTHVGDTERGFSFRRDGPLDMRYDQSAGATASEICSKASQQELAQVFRALGGEPYGPQIAEALVKWRGFGQRRRMIVSTLELRMIIDEAVEAAINPERKRAARHRTVGKTSHWTRDKRGRWSSRAKREKALNVLANSKPKHPWPVRRCFHGLRLAVNSENVQLSTALEAVPSLLAPGGRFMTITYHPAEEIPVVEAVDFMTTRCTGSLAAGFDTCECSARGEMGSFEAEYGEPIRATKAEIKRNRTARSAQLRCLARTCSWVADEPVAPGAGGASGPFAPSAPALMAARDDADMDEFMGRMLREEADRQLEEMEKERGAAKEAHDRAARSGGPQVPYGHSVANLKQVRIVEGAEANSSDVIGGSFFSDDQWQQVMDVDAMAQTLGLMDEDGTINQEAMESFAEMMGEDPLHMEGDAVDIGQLMKEHGIGMEISAVIDEKGHRIPADEFIAQKMREEETQQQAHGRSAGARDGAAGRKKGK